MPSQRRDLLGAVAAAAVVAACGGSSETASTDSTTSTADTGVALAAIRSAFQNFATQPSAHLRVVARGGSNPGTFELDVTKDALTGTLASGGSTFSIVYVAAHGYVQTSPGGPFSQVADADAKAFGLFTIGSLSTCYETLLGAGGVVVRFSGPVTAAGVRINGASGVDYMATDGSGDVAVSTGSPPLPLKLLSRMTPTTATSTSSTSPGCDVGTTTASTSEAGASIEVDWSYPGLVTKITPPAASKG